MGLGSGFRFWFRFSVKICVHEDQGLVQRLGVNLGSGLSVWVWVECLGLGLGLGSGFGFGLRLRVKVLV